MPEKLNIFFYDGILKKSNFITKDIKTTLKIEFYLIFNSLSLFLHKHNSSGVASKKSYYSQVSALTITLNASAAAAVQKIFFSLLSNYFFKSSSA